MSRSRTSPAQLTLAPWHHDRPALQLVLHLLPQDRPTLGLAASNSLEACRIAYMSALKEGDFVRWGNTKRVNGLKRTDQDALWTSLLSSACAKTRREALSSWVADRLDLPSAQMTLSRIIVSSPNYFHSRASHPPPQPRRRLSQADQDRRASSRASKATRASASRAASPTRLTPFAPCRSRSFCQRVQVSSRRSYLRSCRRVRRRRHSLGS